MEVCPACAENRRVLLGEIGGGNLSRPALVQVQEGVEAWEAATCEAVMLAKKRAEYRRELRASNSRPRRRRMNCLVRQTSPNLLRSP